MKRGSPELLRFIICRPLYSYWGFSDENKDVDQQTNTLTHQHCHSRTATVLWLKGPDRHINQGHNVIRSEAEDSKSPQPNHWQDMRGEGQVCPGCNVTGCHTGGEGAKVIQSQITFSRDLEVRRTPAIFLLMWGRKLSLNFPFLTRDEWEQTHSLS